MGCFSSKETFERDEAHDVHGNIYKDSAIENDEAEKAVSARIAQIGGTDKIKSQSFSLQASVTGGRAGELRQESSKPGPRKSVGRDLNSIMDQSGMLTEVVSRQLSHLSHYSVHSECGAVMITPEEGKTLPFKLIKLIGRGGFGNVYLGDWEKQRVAIKIIQGNTDGEQPEEAEWEARKEKMAQMEAILMSAINHPHIVNTLKVIAQSGEIVDPEFSALEKQLLKSGGVAADAEGMGEGVPSFEWHIIMEYADKGSLSKALSVFRLHEPIDGNTLNWDAWATLQTLKEVTVALVFLHENNILHGDLKAANVLLASNKQDRRGWVAKVSDFGLSRVLSEDKTHIKTQTFGTVTHMPPELLAKGILAPSADVYAIGVLMWEMFTAEKVFKQLSDSEVILSVVNKRARPPFPADVPSRYKFLTERCWVEMPELRPTLTQVLSELDTLMAQLCPEGEHSPPIPVLVYPTRQKALQEGLARQAQLAAQQAAYQAQAQAAGAQAFNNQGSSSKKPGPSKGGPPNAKRPNEPKNRASGAGIMRHQSRFAADEAGGGRQGSVTLPRSQTEANGRTQSYVGPTQGNAGGASSHY